MSLATALPTLPLPRFRYLALHATLVRFPFLLAGQVRLCRLPLRPR